MGGRKCFGHCIKVTQVEDYTVLHYSSCVPTYFPYTRTRTRRDIKTGLASLQNKTALSNATYLRTDSVVPVLMARIAIYECVRVVTFGKTLTND